MELAHFLLCGGFRSLGMGESISDVIEIATSDAGFLWGPYVDFHLFVEAVVHNQAMCHSYSVGLHGMPSDVGIVSATSVSHERSDNRNPVRTYPTSAIENR